MSTVQQLHDHAGTWVENYILSSLLVVLASALFETVMGSYLVKLFISYLSINKLDYLGMH